MKFLVPNYSCLQNPWLGGYRPPDPRSLCPLSSTEFVENPPPPDKIPGYASARSGVSQYPVLLEYDITAKDNRIPFEMSKNDV